MIKPKHKSLNNKGFSHVEFVMLVVVAVVLVLIGTYVLKHKSTSHASSYKTTLLGYAQDKSGSFGDEVQACKLVVPSKGLYSIKIFGTDPSLPVDKVLTAEVYRDQGTLGDPATTGGQVMSSHSTSTWTGSSTSGYSASLTTTASYKYNDYLSIYASSPSSPSRFYPSASGSSTSGVFNFTNLLGGINPALLSNCSGSYTGPSYARPNYNPYLITADSKNVYLLNSNNTVQAINNVSGYSEYVSPSLTTGNLSSFSSDGTHIWVANSSNKVYELSAANGSITQTLDTAAYKFSRPQAIVSDGLRVFVANNNGTVTELSATTGALIRIIATPSSGNCTTCSYAIGSNGVYVWLAVGDESSANNPPVFYQIRTSTGDVVQKISGAATLSMVNSYNLKMSLDDKDVWITYDNNNQIIELNATTGALINTWSSPSDGITSPSGLLNLAASPSGNGYLWLINGNELGVVGLQFKTANSSTSITSEALTPDSSSNRLEANGIANNGNQVFVLNGTGGRQTTITELSEAGLIDNVFYL